MFVLVTMFASSACAAADGLGLALRSPAMQKSQTCQTIRTRDNIRISPSRSHPGFYSEANMISSRDLNDLHPAVKRRALAMISACDADGITLLITSTYRDNASQDKLYAQGRGGAVGPVVTNAKGGQSWHNWRLAFDIVPIVNGKPCWNTTGDAGRLWRKIGDIGKSCGLEWAGDWKRFPEFPHFQYTGGLTLADLQSGKTLRGDA